MPKLRVQYFTRKKDGKVYRHPWIGYSQRNQNGTPTFVRVTSLSGLPEDAVKTIEHALRSDGGNGITGEVQFLTSASVGAPWTAWCIGEKLGIWRTLERLEAPYHQAVMAMILDRVLSDRPSSKLDLWERLKTDKSVLTQVADLPIDTPLHDVYASLEKLQEAQADIELDLFQVRNGSVDRIFLYDITSSYFEGENCPLAKFGYNRDGKKGKKQIVIGLLTDSGGMPIAVEVFEGNTSDKTTVLGQIRKIKEKFHGGDLVFVGDRGMLTSSNRSDLEEEEFSGIHYISALPRAELAEILEERATPVEDDLFTRHELFEMEVDGKRVVFKHNPVRAMEDGATRVCLLEKTTAKLESLKKQVGGGRLKKEQSIARRLHRWLDNWNVGKFFSVSYGQGTFDYQIDQEKVEAAMRLDGWFAVVTDLPAGDHTSMELVERYKSLKHVESAFRAMKTTDLFLRPIRHWNPQRVKGHVFLCMLSYMVSLEARRCFADFLAPVVKNKTNEDDEVYRRSLGRAWAVLNTIKTGMLSIGGQEVVQLSPISKEARDLLKAAGVAFDQKAKKRFGVHV